MKLYCKAVMVEKFGIRHHILLNVVSVLEGDGEPFPAHIAIQGDTNEYTNGLYQYLRCTNILIDLQRPPVVLPPKQIEGEQPPSIYEDKYEEVMDGHKFVFKRSIGHLNPNFYNVFYGKMDLGYIAKNLHAENEWIVAPTVINNQKQRIQGFVDARVLMCTEICSLLEDDND